MNIDREVLRIAAELGLDQSLLQAKNRFLDDSLDPDPPVADDIRQFRLDDENREGDVLLPLIEGGHTNNVQRTAILAHAFRSRGYRPILYLCDNDLELCHPRGKHQDDKSACALCRFQGKKQLDSFGLEYYSFDDILPDDYDIPPLNPKDQFRSTRYKRIPVADFATASARRLLKRHHLDLEDPSVRNLFERLLQSAMLLVDLAVETFSEFDIVAVLGNHHAYVYSGTILSTAEAHDIPAYSYAGGFRHDTLCVGQTSNRSPSPYDSDPTTVRSKLERPLSEEEKRLADSAIDDRRSGDNRTDHTPDGEMSSFSRSGSNTHVGLFTNLLWDASLSGSDCAFSDPFEWIRETIEHAREDPGFELLIKTHPAEAMRGTNESICAWIQETWNSLPPNIEVIPPDTDLSPYDVMDNLDVGIVYNSTAGMEMAYAGKPVIVAGYAHYKRYGFTYDIDSPEHYRSIIKSIENLQCDPDMQKIARRYVYYFFYEKHVPFPYSTEMSGEKLFQEIQHTDIGPGNTDFDNLVQSILKNEPVIR